MNGKGVYIRLVTMLTCFVLIHSFAQAQAGLTDAIPEGDLLIDQQTVAPGDSHTTPDGVSVTNHGTKANAPVVNTETYQTKKGEKYTVVKPRPGANFSASGLNSCQDRVVIPPGVDTEANVSGSDYSVDLRGQDGNITLNGNRTHIDGSKLGSGNTVTQNGNNSVANYGGRKNEINIHGDGNKAGDLSPSGKNSNTYVVSGSNNTIGPKQNTKC